MEKGRLFVSIIFLFSVIIFLSDFSSALAWSNNTFNNSLTTESLTFIGGSWKDRLNTSILAYYNFNESSGDLINVIDGIFNGTVTSITSRGVENQGLPNRTNRGYKFGGGASGDVIDIQNNASGQAPFGRPVGTVSVWFNASFDSNQTSTIYALMGQDGDGSNAGRAYIIFNGPGGNAQFAMGNIGVITVTNLASNNWFDAGQWTNLVVTWNDSSDVSNLYINGTLNATSAIDLTGFVGSDLDIGDQRGLGRNWDGVISEVGFWTRTLNSSEISDLYNSGGGISCCATEEFTRYLAVPSAVSSVTSGFLNLSSLTLQNPSLSIGNFGVWNFSGVVNNKTSNIASIINRFLNSTFLIGANYIIPFVFTSEAAGLFEYIDLIFNNAGFIENFQNFTNVTQKGTTEEFIINITYDSVETTNIFANLIYNGTSHSSTQTGTGDNLEFLSTVTTPNVASDTNVTFFWTLTLDSVPFNSTFNNQTVESLSIDNCEVFTNLLFNFTGFDEEEKTFLVNMTIETAVNIFTLDRTNLILNVSNSTANPAVICLSENVTSSTGYVLDMIVKYFREDDYAVEYYNIVNISLNSSFDTQHINLFDLLLNDSTEFEVFFTGDDYLPVEEALVYLDREYVPDNQFLTVEVPLTGDEGSAILHMVASDVRYNIRLVKNGELLANFLNIVAYCPNPSFTDCVFSLSSASSASDIDYDSFSGLIFQSAPVYDSVTNRVSFDFVTADSLVKNVTLNVTRNDVFGNRTVCENSLVSASGTVACNIGTVSDTNLISTIAVDGVIILISSVDIDRADFGPIGFFAWFVITLILILIFAESKNGIVVSLLLSYVGAITLGIAKGNIIGIGSAGVWIIIITVLALWRINKERLQ